MTAAAKIRLKTPMVIETRFAYHQIDERGKMIYSLTQLESCGVILILIIVSKCF